MSERAGKRNVGSFPEKVLAQRRSAMKLTFADDLGMVKAERLEEGW
jgi:hypothetical protein